MSNRYDIMRQFTQGFGASITLSEGYDESKGPHFTAGYNAGYPFRKVKNEKLNEYLISIGRDPQAVISVQDVAFRAAGKALNDYLRDAPWFHCVGLADAEFHVMALKKPPKHVAAKLKEWQGYPVQIIVTGKVRPAQFLRERRKGEG